MQQSLILIRGVPGAGKTLLAQTLQFNSENSKMVEADQFMTDLDGNYKYSHSRVTECHNQCFEGAKKAMYEGYTVIVSNYFTRIWEMQRYLNLAIDLRIPIQVIHCQSEFKNIHNVPEDKVVQMHERFEPLDLPTYIEKSKRLSDALK